MRILQITNTVGKDEARCLTLNVFAPQWNEDEVSNVRNEFGVGRFKENIFLDENCEKISMKSKTNENENEYEYEYE